jgi:CubicO group peptidase (beta-lactamase class C family)
MIKYPTLLLTSLARDRRIAYAAIRLPRKREATQVVTEVKKNHIFGICALVLALMLLPEGPTSYAIAQERVQDLDQYFRLLAANQNFNGVVLVAERGKIVFERSFGYSDFSEHRLNRKDSSFSIASVSKLLTATAILQLVQQDRLQTTDPVVKYLPTFPYPEITIRHLLSHTSGLPPYNAFFDSLREKDPDRVFTNADFLPGLDAKRLPLIYAPGAKGNYDNINYIVLALVLEKVSGESYSSYIDKHILKPASMTHTKFMPLPYQYAELKNWAAFSYPHIYPRLWSDVPLRANTVPYVVSYWRAYGFTGFGDYVSTTHDLLRFDQAYYRGSLLSKSIQDMAFTPIKLNDGSEDPEGFGLGWEMEKDQSQGKIVYHSGAATGLSCILLRNITKLQTILLFDNTHSDAHQVADSALKILNGESVPRLRKSAAKAYVQALLRDGPEPARNTLQALRTNTIDYELDEDEMNSFGYDLMGDSNTYHLPEEHHLTEALEVFKTNTELFPQSWNVYDSYGEALRKAGRTPEAIRMYERSLQLNAGNKSAIKALSEINSHP